MDLVKGFGNRKIGRENTKLSVPSGNWWNLAVSMSKIPVGFPRYKWEEQVPL